VTFGTANDTPLFCIVIACDAPMRQALLGRARFDGVIDLVSQA
jgi:hypothetical protein